MQCQNTQLVVGGEVKSSLRMYCTQYKTCIGKLNFQLVCVH